jgi:mono/diheme cytochrome c family protein
MRATFVVMLASLGAAAGAAVAAASTSDKTPPLYGEIERGRYLSAAGDCKACHTADGGKPFAGGRAVPTPFGTIYAPNITPDKETGIGNWTDAQIIHAIREGVDDEGHIIFPPMPVPTYNNMSDDDVKAIVAYLRTLKPIHNEVPDSKWNVPQQAMPPAKGLPAPPRTDKVAYGHYLATAVAHCFECHSTPDPNGVPDFAHHLGAGGFTIELAPGMEVTTPNITSDPETGIGKWTDADIRKALTEGVTPTGGHISPPMPFPWFKNMTSDDIDAVVAYVRTIPPISNKVERTAFQKQAFP